MVVGGGGREHALVETLAASSLEPEMHAAPGNPGIARIARVADIPADDLISLRDYAKANEIDLTVVGPEDPLIGGIAEAFWEADLKIFGPSRAAARIEGSKVFAKELMNHAGVPTARFEAFDREAAALAYLRRVESYPLVIKADGAAGGKGVTVARSREEAEGPNTGGMGAYSPLMWMEPATYAAILEGIIQPTIQQMALIVAQYTDLLYAGVMVTDEGPKALEFNCRFGDPETQVILPRMGSDLLE